ncbi:MAG: hypothetical protein KKF77_10135 [Proteobacteria bacterium]|nr:hypothetical protein [Pseudomonadota bacterium]
MSRTLFATALVFAWLLAALPCRAADLEAADRKLDGCSYRVGEKSCREVESGFLRKRDAKASREGDSLHIMTLRGPVIFTDTLDEFKHVDGGVYLSLGYFPDIGQHLVRVFYYEGGNYVLVSNTTAETVFSGAAPHVSPSRKRIVVADASEAYTSNQIKIWALESGRLRLEHSEPFKTIVARFVRWEDDASFTVDEYDDSRSADCPKGKFAEQHYTYRWERGILSRSVAQEPKFRCEDNW